MDDDRNNKTGSVWSNELQKIKSIIERENLKFTIQKQLILEALLSSKEHMTINELHDKLKVNNIGIATLYRNLDSFKNLGIITEINVDERLIMRWRYLAESLYIFISNVRIVEK